MAPVLTALALIFIVWLNYEIHKSSRLSKSDMENFWNKEKDSNSSRRNDISALDYITLSTDRLPLADNPDETINSYRDTILKLSGKKMINLSGTTNTELKFKYGISNIKLLTEYDNNYTTFVSMLQKWAERLYAQGYLEDCVSVLEYAVSCYTDVTKSYQLLAKVYVLKNNAEKVNDLIHIIPQTKIQNKDKIIDELTIIMLS